MQDTNCTVFKMTETDLSVISVSVEMQFVLYTFRAIDCQYITFIPSNSSYSLIAIILE